MDVPFDDIIDIKLSTVENFDEYYEKYHDSIENYRNHIHGFMDVYGDELAEQWKMLGTFEIRMIWLDYMDYDIGRFL